MPGRCCCCRTVAAARSCTARIRPSAQCAKPFRHRRPSSACCSRRLEFKAFPRHWKAGQDSSACSPAETIPADDLLRDLGEHWYVDALSFKPWPSCRGTHAAIEVSAGAAIAATIRCRHRLNESSSRAAACRPCWPSPATQVGTDNIDRSKVQPAVHRRVGAHARRGDARQFRCRFTGATPQLRALAARCLWRQRPDWGRERATSGALEIHLRSGDATAPRGAGRAGLPGPAAG